jgi:hypothetical protein
MMAHTENGGLMESDKDRLIESLLRVLEGALVQIVAQKVTIGILCDEEESRFIEDTKKIVAERVSSRFQELRNTLLSLPQQDYPQPLLTADWEEEVRRLIESIRDIGPANQ